MFLLEVQRPNALLKCEERLVDLSAVKPSLTVLVNGVGATLATSQINEAHFADVAVRLL